LDKNGITCGGVERLFESLADGALGSRDEGVLKAHLAHCAACRAKYALDMALIQSIRTAPDEAFVSVAGEVMGRVKVRERRRWLLRWGVTVAAISMVALATGRFGSGIYEAALSLLTGSFKTSPTYLALSKVAGLAVDFAATLKTMILSGHMPGGLGSYAPQMAMLALLTGALVIFMMYAMGRWLGKPMEVNS
jgi:anti-sigma factor RsiW